MQGTLRGNLGGTGMERKEEIVVWRIWRTRPAAAQRLRLLSPRIAYCLCGHGASRLTSHLSQTTILPPDHPSVEEAAEDAAVSFLSIDEAVKTLSTMLPVSSGSVKGMEC